ncbi:MAG: hypothetical protein Q4E75_00980 [bacterium]|nr:hypothetical protein [bacterium]
MEEFKIRTVNESIIIEKSNNCMRISQAKDNDIYFSALQGDFFCQLDFSSYNCEEWKTYLVFENLMKAIFGRYMLNEDYKKKLPKDFIDLDNKTIIWHSDGSTDNILKFQYKDGTIKISILKNKDINNYGTNSVRIRTNGSSYELYYKEFIEFFNQLTILENGLNQSVQEEVQSQKKLTLLKRKIVRKLTKKER